MPKKKSKHFSFSNTETEEAKAILGDNAGMKHALDTEVENIILRQGYQKDNKLSNIKLILGFIAVITAAIAQFWPGKFMENWNLTLACVIIYTIISTILSIIAYFIEGDTILYTKKTNDKLNPIKILTKFPKYEKEYEIIIEPLNKSMVKKGSEGKSKFESKNSVENYFHSDGYVSWSHLESDVLKILHEYDGKES